MFCHRNSKVTKNTCPLHKERKEWRKHLLEESLNCVGYESREAILGYCGQEGKKWTLDSEHISFPVSILTTSVPKCF